MKIHVTTFCLVMALYTQAAAGTGLGAAYCFGQRGAGPGQFEQPLGIAISPSGIVYVADSGNFRIEAFTVDGQFLFQWGTPGSGPGQFGDEAWGIAVNSAGEVLVADHSNNRVQRFSTTGDYLGEFGALGSGPGQFNQVFGLALDSNGRIYVSDYGNLRVQVFTAAGQPLGEMSIAHRHPLAPAVAQDGAVFVTFAAVLADLDTGIKAFDAAWSPVMEWPHAGAAEGLTIGPDGYLYAANSVLHTLQVFSTTGELISVLGGPGSDLGQLKTPVGIAFAPDGSLFVVERGNNRVSVFVGSPTPSARGTWGSIKALYR